MTPVRDDPSSSVPRETTGLVTDPERLAATERERREFLADVVAGADRAVIALDGDLGSTLVATESALVFQKRTGCYFETATMYGDGIVSDPSEYWERRHEITPSPERRFVADGDPQLALLVDVSDSPVVEAYERLRGDLEAFDCVRPTPPAQLHLTVKLFDRVTETAGARDTPVPTDDIGDTMRDLVAEHDPFEAASPRLNLFPDTVYAETETDGVLSALNAALCERTWTATPSSSSRTSRSATSPGRRGTTGSSTSSSGGVTSPSRRGPSTNCRWSRTTAPRTGGRRRHSGPTRPDRAWRVRNRAPVCTDPSRTRWTAGPPGRVGRSVVVALPPAACL